MRFLKLITDKKKRERMLKKGKGVMRRFYSSKTVVSHLSEVFKKSLRDSFPQLDETVVNTASAISLSKVPKVDFQCNGAFSIAKAIKQSPAQVSQKIVSAVKDESIRSLATAGGFVNINLSEKWTWKRVNMPEFLEKRVPERKKKVIIDYASPNMAKELHVGHLRSAILGDCLEKVMTHNGNQVLGRRFGGRAFQNFMFFFNHISEIVMLETMALLSHWLWSMQSKKRQNSL